MTAAFESEIKFELICKTHFGEKIWIVGNIPQLGLWDASKGILLKTDADNYPNWYTENPLMIASGAKFQFKFVRTMQNGTEEWESFPNNLNRKYRARYISVTLKAVWNDFSGREVANKKYSSSSIFSQNEIKVHKFKISGVFVPYDRAGSNSSDDSEDFGTGKDSSSAVPSKKQVDSNEEKKISSFNQNLTESDEFPELAHTKKPGLLGHGLNNIFHNSNNFNAISNNNNNNTNNNNNNNNHQNENNGNDRINFDVRPMNMRGIFQTDEQIKQVAQERLKLQGNNSKLENLERQEPQKGENEKDSKQKEEQYQQQLSRFNDSLKFNKRDREQLKNVNQGSNMFTSQDESQFSNNPEESTKIININNINNNNIFNSNNNKKGLAPKNKGGKIKISSNLKQNNEQEELSAGSSELESSDGDLGLEFKKATIPSRFEIDKINSEIINNNISRNNSKSNHNNQSNRTINEALTSEECTTNQSERSIMKEMKRIPPSQQEVLFAEKLFQSSGHTLQMLFQERFNNNNHYLHNYNSMNNKFSTQKYSFITSENDIVFEASEEYLVQLSGKDELCLATFFLPILLTYDPKTDSFKEEIQENSFHYHFINAYSSMRWVGVLSTQNNIPHNLRDRATTYLIQRHRFYPIFLEEDLLENFLNQFCSNMYDSVMSNQFDIDRFRCIYYDSKLVEEVKMVSFRFAQQISCIIDEDTCILISDYRIIFTIIYLSQSLAKKLNIAYFHDSQFPDLEKLSLLPFGDKLINAILCSNLLSFINYEAAQTFLKYIRLNLQIKYESIRGSLRLIYMGNQIVIQIRNPGVNLRLISSIKSQQLIEDNSQQQQLILQKLSSRGAKVFRIIGVDTLHENNKIELKLKLVQKFIQNHPEINVQLIQIILPPTNIYGKEEKQWNKDLSSRINSLTNQINKQFQQTFSGNSPTTHPTKHDSIILIEENMSLKDRMQYMSIADAFLKTSIYRENEIYPLEYLACNTTNGFCLLSKFSSASYKQIRCCVQFNPQSYSEFERSLVSIYEIPDQFREKVRMKDSEYLTQLTSSIWLEKHIAELKKNAKFMSQANMTGFNKGINFKKVAHQANFRKFNVTEASDFYRKTARRLIILGYVGTLVPIDKYMYIQAEEHQVRRHHQKPSEKVIDILKKLCADRRNMVYIVTELSIDFMDEWFADVKGLGLICENGYWLKVVQENGKHYTDWIKLVELDISWKDIVTRIMESYTIRTPGSSVEVKDSSVVWKYSKGSLDFGSKQAEQMIIQLSPLIQSLKYLELKHSNQIVEVKPINLNKGMVTELLIERMIIECGKIDFVLILGSSVTDEDMFCACQMFCRSRTREFQDVKLKPIYVTIGVKPSNANYYIQYEEVENALELLVMSESFASFC